MARRGVTGFVVGVCGWVAAACSSTTTIESASTSASSTSSTTSGEAGGAGQGGAMAGGAGQGGGVTTTSASGGGAQGGAGQGGSAQGGAGQGGSAQGGAGQGGAPACSGPGPSGDGEVYALKKLYLGDTNRDGSPNPQDGWKQYGMNLDGKVSDKASKDLCQPRAGAQPSVVYPDGDGGIDNSFGKHVLPIFVGLAADVSQKANAAIAAGDASFLLHLVGVAPSGDTCGVSTRYYAGSKLASPPGWKGKDAWPVDPSSLSNAADITSAKIVFASSDVVGGVWRTGATGHVDVVLDVGGMRLRLPIDHARLTMQLDPAHAGATLGTLGGVIAAAALADEMRKAVGQFDASLCSGPAIDSILQQLDQAADILADGTQDPGKVCDGISIGLGFDAGRVMLGGVGPVVDPPPDPCAQ